MAEGMQRAFANAKGHYLPRDAKSCLRCGMPCLEAIATIDPTRDYGGDSLKNLEWAITRAKCALAPVSTTPAQAEPRDCALCESCKARPIPVAFPRFLRRSNRQGANP